MSTATNLFEEEATEALEERLKRAFPERQRANYSDSLLALRLRKDLALTNTTTFEAAQAVEKEFEGERRQLALKWLYTIFPQQQPQ